MFVQEEKIFAGKVLRLHICASDGAEWLEEATEDTSVEKLKERCLKHCAPGSSEDPKSVSHHKLIHAASERVLSDARTILEESVQDEGFRNGGPGGRTRVASADPQQALARPGAVDVLLLIRKRAPSPLPKMAEVSAEEKKKQEQKAPDRDAIFRATANLPSRDMDRAAVQTSPRDFQTELRKILLSLIEVAQKLLALNPDAVELFKKANAMLDEDEDERVDEAALRQLTEMGFPESRAVKALRLNQYVQRPLEPAPLASFPNMSVPQAMEWLIEHAEDPTIDTPLPGPASPGEAAAAGPSAGPSAEEGDEEARDELTEIFKKIRRKREFRADARAVVSLMEMGFDEKEVMDALRVNNNQQNAACEWLLGDRKPSPEELDQGIDPESPLFQAILDNPVVQLGLTNPKTLLAFEDMLENPLNSTQWMNDPETGPVMLQISRVFQTLNRS
ncbi:ubiquitin-associated domain-containing protein 1 isoform X1 [Phacochoerus africanus]|uniref:ubiquitin-associated domain-containing protein 1 isoform X1 n=1 Tax=Phacochoerus africanus TaxID=41426 RepID=UPI001FD9BDCA|nr:ubiquitin-associated domain-containing protein 1 isoform X1 [Phacochoerus africanus]